MTPTGTLWSRRRIGVPSTVVSTRGVDERDLASDSSGWTDGQNQRAALVEYGAGIPRAWAEGFEQLASDCQPEGVPPKRWKIFIDDVGRFLDSDFAFLPAIEKQQRICASGDGHTANAPRREIFEDIASVPAARSTKVSRTNGSVNERQEIAHTWFPASAFEDNRNSAKLRAAGGGDAQWHVVPINLHDRDTAEPSGIEVCRVWCEDRRIGVAPVRAGSGVVVLFRLGGGFGDSSHHQSCGD